MSLRARLVATLLLLAALGLLTLAGVTYATQRSFLTQRVDDQTASAADVVSRQLALRGAPIPGGGPPFGGPPHDGGGRGFGGRPDPDAFDLPPGTYGERRDASGARVGSPVFNSYGDATLPRPELPATLPPGRLVTVSAQGNDGVRFRVRAVENRGPGTGTTIVAVPLTGVRQTLRRLLLVEGLVIVGVLLVLAGVAWALVRLGLRPLERMGLTAGAIAGGDLSRRVEETSERTEVGRLGIALNAMLGRLERAFAEREASEQRLRQFLTDASHELRTPLASIRGYAELFRIGAARKPQDVEKAMSRIEDESARMGVLVEDLLTLARLDEVRDGVNERVDLGALAGDAAADARAMAPDREVRVLGNGPAPVLGDADQLRQVLANLVRNALVHTPAGTAIDVGTTVDEASVLVEVRDHGPGLPTEHPDELFDRFWRAEGGRHRGRAGAGLGLAIVAAITVRHGGEVHAANAPGGGAAFTVRLPKLAP